MKKFILGSVAIILAVCFSAFSTTKKANGPLTLQTYSFWYTVNGSQIDQEFYSGTAVDKNHVPSSPCDGGSDLCLVGSNTELQPGSAVPQAEGDEDNYIREDFQ